MDVARAVALIVALLWPAAAAAQAAADPPADDEIVTAPVLFDGQELFRVRGVTSLPAGDRATAIHDRLTAVAADRTIALDSLRIVETNGISRIQAGDRMIFAVLDADARIEQVERMELAQIHLLRAREALAAYRAARTPAALRAGALRALGATAIVGLLLVLVQRAWRRLDSLLLARVRAHLAVVEIQHVQLMRPDRIWDAVRGTTAAVRSITVVAVLLLYTGYVLMQFPATRGLSSNMTSLALGPLQVLGAGFVRNIPRLIFLVVLFFVFRVLLRLIRVYFNAVQRGSIRHERFDPEWAQPTYKVVRIIVVAFGLVVAYPYIPGSDSAAFQGVTLFLGIIFSFGSTTAVANMVAGYMLIYRRAFKIGDRVQIGETMGDVVETRMQVTHLRSAKNEEVIIPNSQILASEVRNFSSFAREHGVILHTEVGIGYDTAWRQVEAMLVEAARRTEGLGIDPAPFVFEKRLGDFAVVYELNVFCKNVRFMGAMYAALHRNILDVFNEHAVQIMTPAYEGDPSEPKIVPPSSVAAPSAAASH